MIRELAIVVALCGCRKQPDAGPSPLQDAPVHPEVADAAPIAIDAAPQPIAPTVVEVVAGAHSACARMSDATLRCWGANGDGQLGDGTRRDSAVPVAPRLRGVKAVVVGEGYACALIDDTSVACWGRIGFGKPGSPEPTAVPGVRDAKRIFAVGGAGCASTNGGALICWGDVDARGHVTTTGASHAPTPVPGVDHVSALVARAALREDGDVALWLDDGTPIRAGVDRMIELASRDGLVCALRDDGAVRCFGPDVPCVPKPKVTPKPAPPKSHKKIVKADPGPPAVIAQTLPLPPASHLAFEAGVCVLSGRLACLDVVHGCKLVRRSAPAILHMPP